MARQKKTAPPKTKFKKRCPRCGEELFLYITKTGPTWQCPTSIHH